MKPTTTARRRVPRLFLLLCLLFSTVLSFGQVNDLCTSPTVLVSAVAPAPTIGTVKSATQSLSIPTCGTSANSADVFYSFVAKTAYPVVQLTSVQANLRGTGYVVQLFDVSPCIASVSIACLTGTTATLNMNTATTPGGAGLIVGNTYYIRIATNNNSATTSGTASNWNFIIAVADPAASKIEVSRSYINITKGNTGGTIDPGDVLEMRATFIVSSNSADSLSFTDTLFKNNGLALVPNTIALRTNEGLIFRSDIASKIPFTDDSTDVDGGYWRRPNGQDTVIRLNFGIGATRAARGMLANTSKPSVFGSLCIIIATYRVRVYAPYNKKIAFKTGAVTYRDRTTGILFNQAFKQDSLIVYQSVGLCPNAVSASNAVGAEFNGTFGAPSGSAPYARNRGASSYVFGYGYKPFTSGTSQNGPDDYFYAIANNTSTTNVTTINTWPKPDVTPNHRLFTHWDVMGDHTGASNPALGNPACDTSLPISSANPCGYMLVINSAYKTDTAFTYDVSGLCPNTYYEISAWFKNLCAKCGGDSLGHGLSASGYVPSGPGDTSGVKPNIAFDVNGTDYFTTGDITYDGTATGGKDATNFWKKRGFVYLTGPSQTSFKLTLRNNAPGGGGNDWALDDIAVATCLPNMKYSPSLAPTVCEGNALTINDTILSYFNNYRFHQWQRSTDNGATWVNVTTVRDSTPVYNAGPGMWQYITSFTIPPANTTLANNGNLYRVIVATTSANVGSTSCQVTDGFSIIDLHVQNCAPVLATDLLSFTGRLNADKGTLNWISSREEKALDYTVERSYDGISFAPAGTVHSYERPGDLSNQYSLTDPVAVNGKVYYRLALLNEDGRGKYSRIIELNYAKGGVLELNSVVNPFRDRIEFRVNAPVDLKIDISLTDLVGKPIRQSSRMIFAGLSSLSIDETSGLPQGSYIFIIRSGSTVITRKLIKKD